MTVTAARGRRALAVLATTGALLLPAAAATAAPADQADDRAHEAHETDEERAETRPERDAGSSSRDDEVTEDDDPYDNDGAQRPNTPDVDGDADNEHPSGKDKSAEAGNSGNQGRAQHDPDDDGNGPDRSNGGLDQPGGQGGEDLDDQDGNNGCGNDDDFEDDNEGWCGKPTDTAPDTAAGAEDEQEVREVREEDEVRTHVRQDVEEAAVVRASGDDCPAVMAGAGEQHDCDVSEQGVLSAGSTVAVPTTTEEEVETGVLGVTFTQDVPASTTAVLGAAIQEDDEGELAADATLPRTGAGLAGLAAVGLSALAGGTALSRRRD